MRFKKKLIGFFISLCLLQMSFATTSLDQHMNRFVHNAKAKNKSKPLMGMVVKSLSTNRILYQYNANRVFTPASVQKTLTAVAALIYLKPGFRFTTKILASGPIEQGVLHGDLTVKFSGDPELGSDELALLFQQLKKFKIKKITGHVYIDNFAYDEVPYAPGWIWDDLTYGYGAPLNAIIIDHNQFGLHFVPGSIGAHPKVKADLPPHVIHIKNYAHTVNHAPRHCPLALYSDAQNHYLISGCLVKRYGRQQRVLALRNMSKYAEVLTAQFLKEDGIDFRHSITVHRTPTHSQEVAVYYSPPLFKIIEEMLKDSDNLTTNSVFKKIGERYFNRPGSWQDGEEAIKKILINHAKLNFKGNLIDGGAGGSRYSLVKPTLILDVLTYVYHHKNIRQYFESALPIAGVDGTLKNRMYAAALGKRIHAKTGSMTGVSALAGYVRTKHNGTLAFVMMFNNFVGSLNPYRQYQDKICLYLMNALRFHHG